MIHKRLIIRGPAIFAAMFRSRCPDGTETRDLPSSGRTGGSHNRPGVSLKLQGACRLRGRLEPPPPPPSLLPPLPLPSSTVHATHALHSAGSRSPRDPVALCHSFPVAPSSPRGSCGSCAQTRAKACNSNRTAATQPTGPALLGQESPGTGGRGGGGVRPSGVWACMSHGWPIRPKTWKTDPPSLLFLLLSPAARRDRFRWPIGKREPARAPPPRYLLDTAMRRTGGQVELRQVALLRTTVSLPRPVTTPQGAARGLEAPLGALSEEHAGLKPAGLKPCPELGLRLEFPQRP